MSNNNRERDLVLAPNEYAFISDQTKGNVITYVGPYKTSMANTDQPVFFDAFSKRFEPCTLEKSIQTFATAPEGWYIILKNPSTTNKQPQIGTSNTLTELEIGRKVNLPGPCFFSLWPGQMAKIIEGHHLRSNEYLIVRVYEEEQARKNWDNAVMTPQKTTPNTLEEQDASNSLQSAELTMGQLLIIKGTNVSFYIPPTGIEVVKDKNGRYVRSAVTLEQLEYCILLDEDGNQRYIQGPAVVFPNPTETFVEKEGKRKFRAIELDENSGIYVKVIAPYTEGDTSYKVGDELFITGKEQMIYFPRPEHALVKYGEQEIYRAVAIPHGEGRYYLDRNSGEIHLKKGPCMFLPDPREAVIVRRILNSKQVELWFPGNTEALIYNNRLQEIATAKKAPKKRKRGLPEIQQQQAVMDMELTRGEESLDKMVSNTFQRDEKLSQPRTVTLDNKYEGAVTIDLWTGYAVLVTSKTGERKVIAGPKTYLLEYDEALQAVELSTGTPKTDEKTLRTVYLRVMNNKVSDVVRAETKDFCAVDIRLSYRVNFTGDKEKWFDVENYVKFLTDHLRSVIRNTLKQYAVADFYANGINIIREMILGAKEDGKRAGWLFEENGMHIYEVEILDIQILEDAIQQLLFQDKHNEIRKNIALLNQKKELEFTHETELIKQQIAKYKSESATVELDLERTLLTQTLEVEMTKLQNELQLEKERYESQLLEQKKATEINRVQLEAVKETETLQAEIAQRKLEQKMQQVKAEVDAIVQKAAAISPDLIAALQAYGDKALAEKMAETMAPLSIIGGKSVVDVFANLVKGTQLEKVLQFTKKQMEVEELEAPEE